MSLSKDDKMKIKIVGFTQLSQFYGLKKVSKLYVCAHTLGMLFVPERVRHSSPQEKM